MQREIMLTFACAVALAAAAQHNVPDAMSQEIDWTEDSTEVTTVNDIIRMHEDVTRRNASIRHFEDVWSRRGYFNLGYSTMTLTPEENIETGFPSLNGGRVPQFKSSWGVSLQRGTNYRLHKKPIANFLQFNFDWTYIDLAVNHFKAESGDKLYDSNNKREVTEGYHTDSYFYIPWNLEKYEVSYGMNLGPSLTVAPFTHTSISALHFIRLNAYYHIGYHASALFMLNDKDADTNQESNADYDKNNNEEMGKNLKLNWGHGMTNSFGLSITWKFIGLGYEHRLTTLKYKSADTGTFGDESYKFTTSSNRLFLQIRM